MLAVANVGCVHMYIETRSAACVEAVPVPRGRWFGIWNPRWAHDGIDSRRQCYTSPPLRDGSRSKHTGLGGRRLRPRRLSIVNTATISKISSRTINNDHVNVYGDVLRITWLYWSWRGQKGTIEWSRTGDVRLFVRKHVVCVLSQTRNVKKKKGPNVVLI